MTSIAGRASLRRALCLIFLSGCLPAGDTDDEPRQLPDPDGGANLAACADGVDNDGDGLVDHPQDPGCEASEDDNEADGETTACANGEDDDGDGAIDLDDPGCADPTDDDETDAEDAQCGNELDDDDDGLIDLADPGCGSSADDDESDDPEPPACSNELDDDEDGFIDFPADPGCGSEFDDSEAGDGPPLPQCGDGLDNDNDGLVDLSDPGCVSPADPREQEGEGETPACSNGVDDDADGNTDFPWDPGCSAAGDTDEADSGRLPACGNGVDDDMDGQTDFPVDPGCAGVGDPDETDPMIAPACSDGRDNDRDGRVDYPDDRGCESAADGSESGSCGALYEAVELESGQVIRGDSRRGRFESEGSCGGRGAAELVFSYRVEREIEALLITTEHEGNELESVIYVRRNCLTPDTELACSREPLDEVAANTLRIEDPKLGDHYIFLDGATGRGANFALSVEEVPLAQCLNSEDDDADGRTDYPADPGCAEPEDRDETDPDPLPACADDEDNDGDGLIDYPLDVGCIAAADDDEVDVCGQGIRAIDYPVGQPFVLGSTADEGTNNFAGSCGGNAQKEVAYRFPLNHNANITFSVDHPETVNNTLLYVRSDCAVANSELACELGEGAERRGVVSLERLTPGDYFVFVDTAFGLGGDFKLSVEVERLPPGCSDGVDNDEDGFLDAEDIGCAGPEDEDEADLEDPVVCFDQIDNDDDGLVDFPFDPGCATKGAGDEADPEEPPACSNGLDDDEDEATDFPADNGCSSAADDDEEVIRPPQCNNRIDDDQDNLSDFPFDPGCLAPGDLSETDDDLEPQCSDLRDNDRDGLVDFPFDPGCFAAGANSELDPEEAPACANGVDDDEDGEADFPGDPGCGWRADPSEDDPPFPGPCNNMIDDDRDGLTDWPADPGCLSRAGQSEAGPGVRACANGADDDEDGELDMADDGCQNALDDDETDPEIQPWCNDGLDNDEDGSTDWPLDPGCDARGDDCEQQDWGLCDGNCVDLEEDEANCGICGRTCDEGIECIDGFCGGLFAFEGFRENVPDADLGGWEICYQGLYADRVPVANVTAGCQGEFVMYGCRQVGQPNWQLLAMGEREIVFRDTGNGNEVLHEHNGVEWYFSSTQSIGFVAPGTGVSRNSCDTANAQAQHRLCWHTSGGSMNGGYRCGARTGLNGARDWERVIWNSR